MRVGCVRGEGGMCERRGGGVRGGGVGCER